MTQLERGVMLLHGHNVLDQTRYELWTVASVKRRKNGGATATLIRYSSGVKMEATVSFPTGEAAAPFIEFDLSQNDLRHVWNTLTASSPQDADVQAPQ